MEAGKLPTAAGAKREFDDKARPVMMKLASLHGVRVPGPAAVKQAAPAARPAAPDAGPGGVAALIGKRFDAAEMRKLFASLPGGRTSPRVANLNTS